ncbi:hypothetical protein F4782DRAFT_526779 [Xylaria castorea]|nr:hypothetical protein F4782DRAFT_526779 [Xylaria castorea]
MAAALEDDSADIMGCRTMKYIIHHVALPPQLPQTDDYRPMDEEWLVHLILHTLKLFHTVLKRTPADVTKATAIQRAVDMLKNLASIHNVDKTSTVINEKALGDSLLRLHQNVAPIPLYVRAQNAGVMISSVVNVDDMIHFELFELSPLNNAAMSHAGRLQRTFPGCSIAVPREEVQKLTFLQTITDTLANMSHQPAHGTIPTVKKAGQMHQEGRDTTHPKMVTELLAAYLRSAGGMVEVSSILKKTRQDVLWKDARSPWRRSALWLLIRVTLQLFFSRQENEWVKEHAYKNFILFLVAHILQKAGEHDISADLLWTIKAKLTRRRLKLGINGHPYVLQFVDDVLCGAAIDLQSQWSHIQSHDTVHHNFGILKHLPAVQDTIMHLERLEKYLEAINKREYYTQSALLHTNCPLPDFTPSLPDRAFKEFPSATPEIFRLLKFESWVELGLDAWLRINPSNEQNCRELRFVMESYHTLAVTQYQDNPEAMSVMILTILQLWVALDKSAIKCCNLLADYAPDIPVEVLQRLILPEKFQMERLHCTEEYLSSRSSQSKFPSSYTFQLYGHESCFAVQYFKQSKEQQETLSEIERHAHDSRDKKCQELQKKRHEYDQHMIGYEAWECRYSEEFDRRTGALQLKHRSPCYKCKHRVAMKAMTIQPHEWPLPENSNEAKTVVFELLVPPSFGFWRDSTIFVLTSVLGLKFKPCVSPEHYYTTGNIEGLVGYYKAYGAGVGRRISLLSEIKPHSHTHRNVKEIITADSSDICVKNGAVFRYFDEAEDCFVEHLASTSSITDACTFKLSAASAQLQQFLNGKVESIRFSNTAIATQSNCPQRLSLEEYKSMAALHDGSKIIWLNLLRELTSPSVDLRKEDTALIIIQSIEQAGPPGARNMLRETHSILDDERFCAALLGSLSDACDRVSRNWQSAPALSAFISIANRVLSLSSSYDVQQSYLGILSAARAISISWFEMLKQKAQNATEDHVRDSFLSKSVFVALICADSFNMGTRDMKKVLFMPKQAAILIRTVIAINECQHKFEREPHSLTALLYYRWKRLCLRSFPILAEQVVIQQSPALDEAIKTSWAAYQPVGKWHALQAPYEHWLNSKSASNENGNDLDVRFSVLTGELLVNGIPLNRLPNEYETNLVYQALFGKSMIEVLPSSARGMRFSGKQMFAGHRLHFNLSTEQNTLPEACLLVQASNQDSTFELVPSHLFLSHLPCTFVDDFVHWYHTTGDYVEFCPRDRPWYHSEENWKLCRVGGVNAWRFKKGDKYLINFQSTTAMTLSKIFRTLEDEPWIHVTLDHGTSTLQIDLPRLQLGFSANLKNALIKSHQHRGMSVHEHQAVGTLIGLRSKLLLRSNNPNSRDKLIIPNGKILHYSGKDHIYITIDRSSSTGTHVYEIDPQLGRVIDNGTLRSKLVLAYLHGLTSFCLPDPLTWSTGTNAALTILKSAAIRSFPSVSQDEITLLVSIAKLTPRREYYPRKLQEMETVHWSASLGFLSQHSDYYESVNSFFERVELSNSFHPEHCVKCPTLYKTHETLLQREKIRSAAVRVWDFGAQYYTQRYDQVYSARDQSQNSKEAINALCLCGMVFRGDSASPISVKANIGQHLLEFIQDHSPILGSNTPTPPERFRYDAIFLIESSKIIAEEFLNLLKALRDKASPLDKYHVMMWLATLSFADAPDLTVLQVLASFFICPKMNSIEMPTIPSCSLSYGFQLVEQTVKDMVLASTHDFADTQDAKLEKHQYETDRQFQERRAKVFQKSMGRTVNGFVKEIMNQWPCESPQPPSQMESYVWEAYINVDRAMLSLGALFQILCNNQRLKGYLSEVASNVPITSAALDAVVRMPIPAETACYRACGFVSSDDLFSGPAPPQTISTELELPGISVKARHGRGVSLLPNLLRRLDEVTESPYEVNYMAGLRDSLSALHKLQPGLVIKHSTNKLCKLFVQYQEDWKTIVAREYAAIIGAVMKTIEQRLYSHDEKTESKLLMQHFPQPCPLLILGRLSRKRWNTLPGDWKKCLIHYGLALTQLQRANRLLDAAGNSASLVKELENPGHENWDPYEYPESLLLEIENGMLIRNIQERIACRMRNPPSGDNAVMQLNMGEGKSSVIVPIVAASLADTKRLVRVVVAKPQSKQMLQMLVAKLGGLLDRQIYHLPFSRAIKLNHAGSRAITQLLKECMQSGGILLTQPEHILSFTLMGIESCISGKLEISEALTKTLGLLNTCSRDIIDESDENFSVKFELLYTMGLQRPIQYSPQRWICVQYILEIFGKIAHQVKNQYPSSIEMHFQSNGGFPRMRILRADAQRHILVQIAEEVCDKGLRSFPIVRQRKEFRQAVLSYITDIQPSPTVISMVEDDNPRGFWAKSREALLLLRGLLAGGVLGFCFGQKRWRVDYGLDPSRKPETKLALPFRAKDNPTPRSEFSHPEVVIVLTQLSYYYGGLCNEQIDWAFRHLLNSDQADAEFQVWVRGATELSDEFKQISGINLDDRSTCEEEIFPNFRFSRGAINYYLAKNVFPKEMKEFPSKLSASGWDIGKIKTLPTTGFSGTNDSRAVLPLSVNQLDLAEQQHTNALVLEYLLQPENSVALLPSHAKQEVSDAIMILNMVIEMDPPVRVILDVGAQILELDNVGVAREWLSSFQNSEGTEAVVFFNEHDELSVIDRKGRIEPLQVSSYNNQLDLCLVFLDQAHTRGTELKLPQHYRAAVTLGARLTKDRLVQACMRMRSLGQGQSVVFCVPQEIVSRIQQRLPNVQLKDEPTISVSDILAWAVTETWNDTRHNILLWAAQGRRHEKHKGFWAQCHGARNVLTRQLAENFLENEAMSLEDRYRPLQDQEDAHESDDAITRRCQQFNHLELMATVLQEEQERELAPEIEQERQNERPQPADPEQHSVHKDIRRFTLTGRIVNSSEAYMDAFVSLQGTSAASLFDVSKFRPGLLVSADFARTVKVQSSAGKLDGYQRSVQWILTASRSPSGDVVYMMVISPYEANELLSTIKKLRYVALHLYAPRPNLGYRSLDKLDLYTVPEALKDRRIPHRFITELNLFAGQLYIGSFAEYIDICKFLGLAWEPAKDGEVIGADGFIHLDHAGRVGGESGLPASPVEFFKVLFTKIRRNCETIDKTHMGQILDNQLLSPEDFE